MNFKGWHLDKRFSIGHVITTLVVGTSALWYFATLETRITVLEHRALISSEQQKQAAQDITYRFDKMTDYLIRIETKLDNKADKERR